MARSYLIPFLVSLCLTGCTGDAGLSTSSSNSVLQGAVKLGIPSGYCVDKASSREENDSATVLMGRCSDRASVIAALITLSVGQPGSGGVMVAGAVFFFSRLYSSLGSGKMNSCCPSVLSEPMPKVSAMELLFVYNPIFNPTVSEPL